MAINLRREWRIPRPPDVPFEINWDSPQSNGLVLWMPLFGADGNADRYVDRIKGLTFTKGGTPVWTADSMFGNALLFDGTNDYLDMADVPLTGAPLTISAWVKLDQLPSVKGAFECAAAIYDADAVNFFALVAESTNDYLQWRVSVASATSSAETAVSVSANTWQHWCGIEVSSTNRRVLLDGRNRATNTTSRVPLGIDGTSIGYNNTDSGAYAELDGTIADVRIYNRALTDAEVWQLYDPATRWELYRPALRMWTGKSPVAARIPRPPAAYNNLAIY